MTDQITEHVFISTAGEIRNRCINDEDLAMLRTAADLANTDEMTEYFLQLLSWAEELKGDELSLRRRWEDYNARRNMRENLSKIAQLSNLIGELAALRITQRRAHYINLLK